jgi:hypothetical protein
VLVAKYGVESGGWTTNKPRGTNGCSVWKQIRMGWDGFATHVDFDIGLGNQVLFWHDSWCLERPLKEDFPELFGCSLNQNATIESVLVPRGLGHLQDWNVIFRRGFNDWQLDQVLSFFSLLHSHIPRRKDAVKLIWKPNHEGFDSHSF